MLALVLLAFQHDQRTRELVAHFGTSTVQFLLAPAELLELSLLFFNLFLLALELEQLVLRFLDLRVEMLGSDGFFA